MRPDDNLILVTGATGRQGGAVARHLIAEGWPLRALVRDPEKPQARELASKGVELVRGDLEDRPSLEPAVRGTWGVYSVQTWREAGPQAEERQGVNLAEAAAANCVGHFVYSSVGGAERRTGIPHFEGKWHIERHIRELGLPYTIWRPASFMENFLRQKDEILAGRLHASAGPGVPVQYIAVDDIGAFVAMSFREPERFMEAETEIAGDELTVVEIADIFSEVLGREIEVVPQEPPSNEGEAAMRRWIEEHGYEADVHALRRMLPALKTFEEWVRETEWAALAQTAAR